MGDLNTRDFKIKTKQFFLFVYSNTKFLFVLARIAPYNRMCDWPVHGKYLIPGVNDTWNHFQKFCSGKCVSPEDWKSARQKLHDDYREHILEGGKAVGLDTGVSSLR